MFETFLKDLQFLVILKLLFGIVVFSIFWARTRFWLPTYVHVLAAIGLILGVWCVFGTPNDSSLNQHGPVLSFLSVLIFPGMVYFFFLAYGGQQAAYRSKKPKTAGEMADIIERFLKSTSFYPFYPEEWKDIVNRLNPDDMLDSYRKRCELLFPRVSGPDPQDPKALEELRNMIQELRSVSPPR